MQDHNHTDDVITLLSFLVSELPVLDWYYWEAQWYHIWLSILLCRGLHEASLSKNSEAYTRLIQTYI